MGLVHAEVEIINGGDLEMVRRNLLDQDEVKRMTVTMLVDTGAYNLRINEEIQEQLQLPVVEKRKGMLADGSNREYDVVGPIEIRFKNRRCNVDAMVLPGNSEPLLGAIPLEDMDVIIHPQRQELIVNPDHPYFAQMSLKGFREG
ncbi:MAG TPA: clan AA aspartic protease [Saprospiraceae bacterium]|nr:clan AA aspartic protease [Saprospiraceae bacterium]